MICFIFIIIIIISIGFVDEENYYDHKSHWLSYCSTICLVLGDLLLFISHWTYSMSCQLQFSTAYVRYGFSTYFFVI
jgi:hypothetical protein